MPKVSEKVSVLISHIANSLPTVGYSYIYSSSESIMGKNFMCLNLTLNLFYEKSQRQLYLRLLGGLHVWDSEISREWKGNDKIEHSLWCAKMLFNSWVVSITTTMSASTKGPRQSNVCLPLFSNT